MKQTDKKQYESVELRIMLVREDVVTASLLDASFHDYGEKWGWDFINPFKS